MPHIVVVTLVALVALEHLYFLYLEMFRWTHPATRRAFGLTAEFAEQSKSLAANQGLYNGFLAAGLVWSLLHPDPLVAHQLQLFFLGCVLVAAMYGGWSVKRSIMLLQGLPAALAMIAVLFVEH